METVYIEVALIIIFLTLRISHILSQSQNACTTEIHRVIILVKHLAIHNTLQKAMNPLVVT